MSLSLDSKSNRERIIEAFPALGTSQFHITSPITPNYNCIAWAANDQTRWWWPDSNYQRYWPCCAPRDTTLQAFLKAFQSLGYQQIKEEDIDSYIDVIAFMTKAASVTHAIRRLKNGLWGSKLGDKWDIEHELYAIEGETYGRITAFMGRGTN